VPLLERALRLHLEQALEVSERIGARPVLERTRADLARLG
jgi:hypothetical protein